MTDLTVRVSPGKTIKHAPVQYFKAFPQSQNVSFTDGVSTKVYDKRMGQHFAGDKGQSSRMGIDWVLQCLLS